ncbi:hypothetical protein ABK040_015859 [Willaertia magna]
MEQELPIVLLSNRAITERESLRRRYLKRSNVNGGQKLGEDSYYSEETLDEESDSNSLNNNEEIKEGEVVEEFMSTEKEMILKEKPLNLISMFKYALSQANYFLIIRNVNHIIAKFSKVLFLISFNLLTSKKSLHLI